MERDWARLGRAVAAARKASAMTQDDLATAVGVGRSTIQSLERGARQHPKILPGHRAIARAVGWTEDSIEAILAGGDPKPADIAEPGAVPDSASVGAEDVDELLDDLSERVRLALLGGKVVDGDVIDNPADPNSHAVLIFKRGHKADATPEQRRADMLKWAKLQRAAREIFSEDEPR